MREVVAALAVDPAAARVYEEGWQSWSPSTAYRLADRPIRPADARQAAIGYRADALPPGDVFCGEGLLAVFDGDRTHVVSAASLEQVPSIRAHVDADVVRVSADEAVEIRSCDSGIGDALAAWADVQSVEFRADPTVWCSWYQYFTAVTEADVRENLAALERLDLPVDVVQIDDGYQAAIGDWLVPSDRFTSLAGLVRDIRASGRRAGIWVAPWLVAPGSVLAQQHPQWLVPDVSAGHNWGHDLRVLDTTHPGAAQYLADVLGSLVALGVDYVKLDFLYAGALRGRRSADADAIAAYRDGLGLMRAAVGDAYLVACGAPTMASRGLVDAMRVSPDTGPHVEPVDGRLSEPGQRSAILTGVGRHWQNRRLWVADPDCLIVRPEVEQREQWAAHCLAYGGLRSVSDRLDGLDDWGLATTRQYLSGGE